MSQENGQNVAEATQEVLKLTISGVLALLDQGMSRKEIAAHYGRTQTDMQKMVWGHPKLKNRKAKKQYSGIELEDDTEDVIDVVVTQETLDMNPDLVAEGIQVGEVLQVEANETEEIVSAPEETNAFGTETEEVASTTTEDWK